MQGFFTSGLHDQLHSGKTHHIIPMFTNLQSFTLYNGPLAAHLTHRHILKNRFEDLVKGLEKYKSRNPAYKMPEIKAARGWRDVSDLE